MLHANTGRSVVLHEHIFRSLGNLKKPKDELWLHFTHIQNLWEQGPGVDGFKSSPGNFEVQDKFVTSKLIQYF